MSSFCFFFFFFQAEDGIRDDLVTGVQTCALPIFREAGIESGQKVEQETAEARVVLGQVVEERLAQVLRRTYVPRPAVDVDRAGRHEGEDGAALDGVEVGRVESEDVRRVVATLTY